jgi:hypothetical protein
MRILAKDRWALVFEKKSYFEVIICLEWDKKMTNVNEDVIWKIYGKLPQQLLMVDVTSFPSLHRLIIHLHSLTFISLTGKWKISSFFYKILESGRWKQQWEILPPRQHFNLIKKTSTFTQKIKWNIFSIHFLVIKYKGVESVTNSSIGIWINCYINERNKMSWLFANKHLW